MKLIRQIGAPLLALAAFPMAAAAGSTVEHGAKEIIRVENAKLDLGEITAGNEAVGTFILHNDGDVEMRLLRAKPS